MSFAEVTFILTLIVLAVGAFLIFLYLNKLKPTKIKKHINQVAGSWVWMLSLLFGAYALGELATAILIVLIGIKGLHETSHLIRIKNTNNPYSTINSNQNNNTNTSFKTNKLSLSLVVVLTLMVACWLELNQLSTEQSKRSLVLFMMFVVQFNDVNQYIAGYLFGNKIFKRKLAPTISPNKTIEGAIFGTLITGVLALPIGFALTDFSLISCFVISVIMGLCGILGDLFQSAVKRSYGVKDMGSWIKGHGGIMDRVDSLLIAVPVYFVICRLIL